MGSPVEFQRKERPSLRRALISPSFSRTFSILSSSPPSKKHSQDVGQSQGNRVQHDGGHQEEDAQSQRVQRGFRRQRKGSSEYGDRVEQSPQIQELEEQLNVVGQNMKTLELSDSRLQVETAKLNDA